MARDPVTAVQDVLREIDFLERLAKGRSFEAFRDDPVAFRAAAYAIQIISEAVRGIPADWLSEFPDEPWSAIKATGNKIRHEYYRIDEAILWSVMTVEGPALRIVLERMLASRTAG